MPLHEHFTSGERQALAAILAHADPRNGDDCALVDVPGSGITISSDSTVEGVHVPVGAQPHVMGVFAAARALSDLAAAASAPLALTCAIQVPEGRWNDAVPLVDGIRERARSCGCDLVGGDVSSAGASPHLAVVVTVTGSPDAATPPPGRSGARPGDLLVVTGSLGRAAVAFHDPAGPRIPDVPDRITVGAALAPHVTSMIDVSDGVARDAEHLASASGVDLHVALDQLPLAHGCEDPRLAAAFGDDYELLCTVPPERFAAARDAVRAVCGEEALTSIGRATDGNGTVHLSQDGRAAEPVHGFEHGRPAT